MITSQVDPVVVVMSKQTDDTFKVFCFAGLTVSDVGRRLSIIPERTRHLITGPYLPQYFFDLSAPQRRTYVENMGIDPPRQTMIYVAFKRFARARRLLSQLEWVIAQQYTAGHSVVLS